MAAPAFTRLAAAWTSAHLADQMLLALLPLLLTAAGTEPWVISGVVAAHAAAWLLVSLPVGAWADAVPRRRIMMLGAGAIAAGSLLGIVATVDAGASPLILGSIAFLAASGVVMLVLAGFALLPRIVEPAELARSNAALEFGRAVTAIVAPILAAHLVARSSVGVGFGLALGGGLVALLASRALPVEPGPSVKAPPLLQSIREGAAFVVAQPVLRAIAACAIAWNSGFFALTAVFAPYAAQSLGLSIEAIGLAWSCYGAGLVLGALLAPVMIARLPTGVMLCFGPALSGLAACLLVAVARPGVAWPAQLTLFCLGFGPMTWLVLQTSLRQILTPQPMLGRVGAVITTAIYGVRPIGALLAGALTSSFGLRAAVMAAAVLFVLSTLAMLLSPASRLRTMPPKR